MSFSLRASSSLREPSVLVASSSLREPSVLVECIPLHRDTSTDSSQKTSESLRREQCREAVRRLCSTSEDFHAEAVVTADTTIKQMQTSLALSNFLKNHDGDYDDNSVLAEGLVDMYEDIMSIAHTWMQATQLPKAHVQVSLIRSTMCSRLHVDHVHARAMCTFFGKGTEWLDADQVSRTIGFVVSDGGNALGDALKSMAERLPMKQAREDDVVLIKGTKWPGAAKGSAILHRSPLVDAGEFRLFVKVDEEGGGDAM
ncbi:succinylglutamate desuccinylase [Pycnococcus provasolii]